MCMWLHRVVDLVSTYIWFNIGQPYIHRGLFQTLLSLHLYHCIQDECGELLIEVWLAHFHLYLLAYLNMANT